MDVLIAIALKSLLIAGLTLGLLALMKRRSAAERSWVAHIGLLALVIMAFAPLVLPSWTVEAPALLGEVAAPAPVAQAPSSLAAPATAAVVAPQATAAAPAETSISAAALATAAYAVPAAILLLITFLALARLIALRARADVLVDGHWLSALARAQRRMGFKHGTALLTSNELSSPISWGLMRPVILLNNRAVEASGEAEAIIAHELAHVARMDWIKLLLARVATALFWFNPFVWLLAREAHQLREEAADDAVLAADIADTDYAELLVGVARHECPGLLLGAHGVAPSRSSLARRVARVLDGSSTRGPVARSFAFGVFVGAVLIAAPLAALTVTPGGSSRAKDQTAKLAEADPASPYYTGMAEAPKDLASIIADGVSTSVQTAIAAVEPEQAEAAVEAREAAIEEAIETAANVREVALARAERATERARDRIADKHIGPREIDQLIELKATGVTSEYVAAMRAAIPRLASVDVGEFAGMKAVGVTPEYARSLAAAGFRNITADQLTGARAVGITGAYISAMTAAGVHGNLDKYIELYAVGVRPEYVSRLRKAGYVFRDADQLVQMQALGIGPRDLRSLPPPPPGPPKAPPRNWNPVNDPDPDGG